MYTVTDFELWDQNVGVVENCVARIHNSLPARPMRTHGIP